MHVTVPVQPLLMYQTDEALEKLGAPYLDGSTGLVPMEHGFDCSDEWVWESTFHETVPSKIVNVGGEVYIFRDQLDAVFHGLTSLVEQVSFNYVC
jgi:hypothetical protein